jgi:hypothetical protein
MLLYARVLLWFAKEGHRHYQPLTCAWYMPKADPTFADMLAALRRQSVQHKVLGLSLTGSVSRKVQQLLENWITPSPPPRKVQKSKLEQVY